MYQKLLIPNFIRTKAEAVVLAEKLAPKAGRALASLLAEENPPEYPRYHLMYNYADRLQQIFEWLFDDKTRIYKRARWHLFYLLARNLTAAIDENGGEKVSDWHRERRAQEADREAQAEIMNGQGDGI